MGSLKTDLNLIKLVNILFCTLCAIFLLISVIIPRVFPTVYSVQMQKVIDGDTFLVRFLYEPELEKPKRFPFKPRVRLYGVDAPESEQPFGKEAKELARVLEDSTVDVTPMNEDGYGRTVALVRLSNGELLQEWLLRQGAVWVYPQFCTIPACSSWKELEKEARRNGRGLWGGDTPMEPWRWRKGKTCVPLWNS